MEEYIYIYNTRTILNTTLICIMSLSNVWLKVNNIMDRICHIKINILYTIVKLGDKWVGWIGF